MPNEFMLRVDVRNGAAVEQFTGRGETHEEARIDLMNKMFHTLNYKRSWCIAIEEAHDALAKPGMSVREKLS